MTDTTITIDLPKKIETRLREKAKSCGQDGNSFVTSFVEREVLPTWEELGLTEEDIGEIIDAELAAVRKEKPLWSR